MSTLDGSSHRDAGRPYLRYTPDVEVQQPDEAALTAEILDVMARSNHVAFEAGSQAAVEMESPASPPVPASFASTSPERQERTRSAASVLAALTLVMALGP